MDYSLFMPDPSVTLDDTTNEISVFTADQSKDTITVMIKGAIYVPTDYSYKMENMYASFSFF